MATTPLYDNVEDTECFEDWFGIIGSSSIKFLNIFVTLLSLKILLILINYLLLFKIYINQN